MKKGRRTERADRGREKKRSSGDWTNARKKDKNTQEARKMKGRGKTEEGRRDER